MSPSPLLLLILLVVVVVMATSSFAVHKTQILLQSLKNNGEGIIRNMVGNYLKYQKSNPVERELKKKKRIFSPTKVSRSDFYQESIGLTLAIQNQKFPLKLSLINSICEC